MCGFCGEEVVGGQEAPVQGSALHRECHIRLVVGSVAHLTGRCSCFVPGSYEDDPPGMTLREAAWAAVQLYYKRNRN
jgi:hypothetical protein